MTDFLDNAPEYNKDAGLRGIVVYEPFLFSTKYNAIESRISKFTKKLAKRLYVVSIMNEHDTVSKVLALSTNITMLMHFCIRSEEVLVNNIRVNDKGETISGDKVKQIFTLVSCDKLLMRLKDDDIESADLLRH